MSGQYDYPEGTDWVAPSDCNYEKVKDQFHDDLIKIGVTLRIEAIRNNLTVLYNTHAENMNRKFGNVFEPIVSRPMVATIVLPDAGYSPNEWKRRISGRLEASVDYINPITPVSVAVDRGADTANWKPITKSHFGQQHYATDCAHGIREFAKELQAEAEARNWCPTYDTLVDLINRSTNYPWLLRREPPKPKETDHRWRVMYANGSVSISWPTQQDARAGYPATTGTPAHLIHTWRINGAFEIETIPW